MHIANHLEELRARVLRACIVTGVATAAAFAFAPVVFHWLLHPYHAFLITHGVTVTGTMLQTLEPAETFKMSFRIALVLGLAGVLPYLLYEVWAFVQPGLTSKERRLLVPTLGGGLFLFVCGAFFAYAVAIPMGLRFFWEYSLRLGITPAWTVTHYIDFLLGTIAAFGLAFELPLVLMLLAALGLVTPQLLMRQRRYAYFLIAVLAAMLTPPDALSMAMMGVPLLGLYELSIGLARWVYRPKDALALLLCCVGCLAAAGHTVAAGETLDVRTCYELALRRNTTVAISQEEIAAASARYLQTLGGVMPRISVRASEFVQQSTNNDPTVSNSFTRQSRPEVAVTLTQPLFQGLREFQALRMAHADSARLRELEANARRQLFLDVATAFFTVAKVEQEMRTLQRIVQVMRARAGEIGQRVVLGKSREGERLAQATELALVEADLERQRGMQKIAYEMLTFLTDLDPHPPIRASDQGQALEPLHYYVTAASTRPDVAAATAAVDIAKGDVRVRRSELLPKVDLNANYYPYRVGFQKEIHWDAQATLTVPVFNLGAIGSVREGKVKVKQAELRATEADRQAATEVKRAYAASQASRRQLARYHTATRTAGQSYQQQVADFQLGIVSNLEVLQSQRSWFEAMRLHDTARVQTWLDWTTLQVTAGLVP